MELLYIDIVEGSEVDENSRPVDDTDCNVERTNGLADIS
jgi:hypothetical protein